MISDYLNSSLSCVKYNLTHTMAMSWTAMMGLSWIFVTQQHGTHHLPSLVYRLNVVSLQPVYSMVSLNDSHPQ